MRLIPAQIVLVPLALCISALLMVVGLGHMSVHEVSPVMASQEAVQKWIDQRIAINRCLPSSIDINTVQQDVLPTNPGKGHWFTTLRCNHRSIYMQWAILLIAPWLIMNLVLIFFTQVMPRDERNYDYFH